jgi:hypothetical protein
MIRNLTTHLEALKIEDIDQLEGKLQRIDKTLDWLREEFDKFKKANKGN